jgi:hypothetical protein
MSIHLGDSFDCVFNQRLNKIRIWGWCFSKNLFYSLLHWIHLAKMDVLAQEKIVIEKINMMSHGRNIL